jgi:3-oxoadipate enol-lactonase
VQYNYSESWIAAHQDAIEASIPRFEQLDMVALVELMKSFQNYHITDQLKAISVPTLVVIGEDDLIKGRKYSDIIVRQIPQAEYAVIPGSGHALCLDKPDILNTLLLGFVLKNRVNQI